MNFKATDNLYSQNPPFNNPVFVILSYNLYKHTLDCFNSVIHLLPNAHIIIVHNGTEQGQIENIKNEILKINQKESLFNLNQIEHLIISENKGFTAGINQGLKYAFENFNYVYFLTNDTELISVPSLFQNFTGQVSTDQNFSGQNFTGQISTDQDFSFTSSLTTHFNHMFITVPEILFKKSHQIDSLGGTFIPSSGSLTHNKIVSTDKKNKSVILNSFNSYFYIPGTAFGISKLAFESIGNFNTDLGTYWEDVDYSMRAQNLNIQIQIDQNFKLTHKVGKTCHKKKYYTTYLYQRNRLYISWKYSNLLERSILFGVILKNILTRIIIYLKNKNKESLKLYFQALLDGLKMIIKNKHTPYKMSQKKMT